MSARRNGRGIITYGEANSSGALILFQIIGSLWMPFFFIGDKNVIRLDPAISGHHYRTEA